MIGRTIIAATAVSLFFSVPAEAEPSCRSHWLIDNQDPFAQEFCAAADAANARNLVPIMKKPKCPRNGPSSKCNPSSITVPEGVKGALIALSRDGGYSVSIVQSSDYGKNDILEAAKSEYGSSSFEKPNGATWENDIWQMTKPQQLRSSDEFQLRIKETNPWLEHYLNLGNSAVFILSEEQ